MATIAELTEQVSDLLGRLEVLSTKAEPKAPKSAPKKAQDKAFSKAEPWSEVVTVTSEKVTGGGRVKYGSGILPDGVQVLVYLPADLAREDVHVEITAQRRGLA